MAGGWISLWTEVLEVCPYKSVCSLQCCFLIDDVLLCSGDIHDQVRKLSEIVPNFDIFGPPNLGGGATQISAGILKILSPSNVTKFGDDRPSDLGD